MPTSTPGTPDDRGFTLVELAVVLLVLGLIVWIAAPRLSSIGGRDRDAVFRDFAAGSEAAFDLALFEKREVRLVIDPGAGTYAFVAVGREAEGSQAREIGERLAISGIQVDGEERPPDITTEIRYRPGGRVPATRIFFRETGRGGEGAEWTLTINPFDGSVDVREGRQVA
ncbi:MAG: prepilin-type N-terminal cleavage/methylation domain-containing protein [Deltaproteobacteria bacterium]